MNSRLDFYAFDISILLGEPFWMSYNQSKRTYSTAKRLHLIGNLASYWPFFLQLDDLYSSFKWPFWQANIKNHLILVYWDVRNSLLYYLVIPFKDGVTFVVTTATQSLQQCYLENVADVTYVAVTKCHFGIYF